MECRPRSHFRFRIDGDDLQFALGAKVDITSLRLHIHRPGAGDHRQPNTLSLLRSSEVADGLAAVQAQGIAGGHMGVVTATEGEGFSGCPLQGLTRDLGDAVAGTQGQ